MAFDQNVTLFHQQFLLAPRSKQASKPRWCSPHLSFCAGRFREQQGLLLPSQPRLSRLRHCLVVFYCVFCNLLQIGFALRCVWYFPFFLFFPPSFFLLLLCTPLAVDTEINAPCARNWSSQKGLFKEKIITVFTFRPTSQSAHSFACLTYCQSFRSCTFLISA